MENKTNNISETEINQNGLKGMNQFISATENIFEMITNNQLLKDAEQGDADAQCILGSRFATGDCVEKNEVKAAKWYRKAAEQGLARGQYNLAQRYRYGGGVDIDLTQAKYWYEKAAAQGHENAKKQLDTLK